MLSSMEEEPKPNLNKVINNIQIEHIVFIEHVVIEHPLQSLHNL
jgi:hypothetical protein